MKGARRVNERGIWMMTDERETEIRCSLSLERRNNASCFIDPSLPHLNQSLPTAVEVKKNRIKVVSSRRGLALILEVFPNPEPES